jgi:rhodanese-related sulfurtransferase/DNA-binding transcriptional ArsR family regulator
MSTGPKQQLFDEFATIARAIGNGGRIEILEHLSQTEKSVDALAEAIGLTVANTSQHLQYLKRAGLVTSRREGKYVLYRVAGDDVVELLQLLFRLGEKNIAEVDRVLRGYFHERDSMEPVSHEDLLNRTRDGLVTVLDVRPADEYAAGHIPGAVNIPLKELKNRLSELEKGKEVIAYCRGPYCVLSFEAVAALRGKGLNARRLEDGLPEWRAAGLPVEST